MSTKKGNGIPASRQKNCNACVQAKRRCDRRVPVCSRCISKQVACTYGQTERAISGSSPKDGFEAAPFTEGLQVGSSSYPAFSPEPSLGVDYLGTMPMDSQLENPTLGSLPLPALDADSNDDIPMDPFFNMLDTASTSNKDQWLIPTQQGYVGERPNTPADEGTELAYQKMACFCVSISQLSTPWHPNSCPRNDIFVSLTHLTFSIQDDVQPWQLYDTKTQMFYLVNRVKGFTSDAAARNATPFMHKYLYKSHTPPCILDCFSTNVIYSNRTPENMAMVMRAVQRSVTELIQNETGRTVVTPIEKLARTQTLFLLQIIRLLDGDVILRAQGENDIPLLKIWLGELCRVRENLGTPADAGDNAIGDQPPHDWEVSHLISCVSCLLTSFRIPDMDLCRVHSKDDCYGVFYSNAI